jgi:hypothetical protein
MMNNTMNESTIEKNVMRRVHRISILRLIISGTVFAVTLALLALYGIGREVWVAQVFENGPQSFLGHTLYLLYAFEHTRFVVQALALLCIGSLVYLVREAVRFIGELFFSPARV